MPRFISKIFELEGTFAGYFYFKALKQPRKISNKSLSASKDEQPEIESS